MLLKTNNMTAVEWLEIQFEKYTSGGVNVPNNKIFKLTEKAKAMEKEQRIRDYNAGYTDAQCNHINDAENYVNEQEYLNSKL
jgi:hypothetical protein